MISMIILFANAFIYVIDTHTQDILEKIRECGSSVTYYGGRVLNNQSPEMSPMTKAIMREIHNDDNVCEVCQPNKCPHSGKIFTSFCGRGADSKHLGKPSGHPISVFFFLSLYFKHLI